jgi:hypothetical protein
MTCSTFRCRQLRTKSGSGRSGISATIAGTLPLGFRPGLPFGLAPSEGGGPGGGCPRETCPSRGACAASAPAPALTPPAGTSASSTKPSDTPSAPAYRFRVESCASCRPDSSRATADCDVPISLARPACDRPDAARRWVSQVMRSGLRAAASVSAASRSASAAELAPE